MITSPWSSLINRVDSKIILTMNFFQNLNIRYDVFFPALEAESRMEQGKYQPADLEILSEASLAEIFGLFLIKYEDVGTIWYFQDDSEVLNKYSGIYFKFLNLLFSNRSIFVFSNYNRESVRVFWPATDSLKVIPQSVINTVTFSKVLAFYDSSKNLIDQLLIASSGDQKIVNKHLFEGSHIDKLLTTKDLSEIIDKFRKLNQNKTFISIGLPFSELNFDYFFSCVLQFSRKYRILNFDLGFIDLDEATVVAKLSGLAKAFEDLYVDINFQCTISEGSDMQLFSNLKEARINSVTILADEGFDSDADVELKFIKQTLSVINKVKRLHGLEMDVRWMLRVLSTPSETDIWIKLLESVPAFYGFPPPNGILLRNTNNQADEIFDDSFFISNQEKTGFHTILKQAIDGWRKHRKGHYLASGRGATFLKLFDKRGRYDSWYFIRLNSIQSKIYSLMDDVVDLDTVKKKFNDLNSEKIEAFLLFMEKKKVIISIANKYYLNASRRRNFSETWASAEL